MKSLENFSDGLLRPDDDFFSIVDSQPIDIRIFTAIDRY